MFQEKELYFTNSWNILDFFTYAYGLIVLVIFLIEVTTNGLPIELSGFMGRFGLSLMLFPFFLKLLPFLLTSRKISIHIIMIIEMAKDLLRFILIFIVFGLAYGITFRASLVKESSLGLDFFVKVFLYPFYFLIADIPVDLNTAFAMKVNEGDGVILIKLNSYELGFLLTFITIFLIISSILLFNVLTAMFTKTYEGVQKNSEKIYVLLKYDMVSQYKRIPVIPGPTMIFSNLGSLIIFLIWLCNSKLGEKLYSQPKSTKFRDFLKNIELEAKDKIGKMETKS